MGRSRLNRLAGRCGFLPMFSCAALAGAAPQSQPGVDNFPLEVAAGLAVHHATAPPLVHHPVALDWTDQGDLYVAEWTGESPNGKPQGRIVLLRDTNQDGGFDQRVAVLESLPLVTSILVRSPGLFLAAAPDLLYAEDRDGDGRLESLRRLWIGFGAESADRSFNSLSSGTDGWIYAANGLGGGRVRPLEPLPSGLDLGNGAEVNLAGTDFRLNPRTGRLEPVAGLSWVGRTSDAADHWFGRDPDLGLVQFPLPRRYPLRNPAVRYPDPVVPVEGGQVLRATRSDDPTDEGASPPPGSVSIHSGPPLGPLQPGDLIATDPQQGTVSFLRLQQDGILFTATAEDHRWLVRSTEDSFTPVQARTGPDDAVWVVDFGRWTNYPGGAAALDGRIYRVTPVGASPGTLALCLASLREDPLSVLAGSNGVLRRMAQDRILEHNAPTDLNRARAIAIPVPSPVDPVAPRETDFSTPNPEARISALRLLEALDALDPPLLAAALEDPSAPVRKLAIGLAEARESPEISAAVGRLVQDPSPEVRFQLALSSACFTNPAVASWLHRLAHDNAADPWMRLAILASASDHALPVLCRLLEDPPNDLPAAAALIEGLVTTLLAVPDTAQFEHAANSLTLALADYDNPFALAAVATLIQSASPRMEGSLAESDTPWKARIVPWLDRARRLAEQSDTPAFERSLALRTLARQSSHLQRDIDTLLKAFSCSEDPLIRRGAQQALLSLPDAKVGPILFDRWWVTPPSLRQQLLGVFLERPAWTRHLATALESGRLSPQELSLPYRQRWLERLTGDEQYRVLQLLAEAQPEQLSDVVDAHLPALRLRGDPTAGSTLFAQRCAGCHQIGPIGHSVGPDLTRLARRTPRELLESILDPNAQVDPGWRTYLVETRADEVLTGTLAREHPTSVVLAAPGGLARELSWAEIRELRASRLSLMPEGLEQGLSSQDLADLLAFLEKASAAPEVPSVPPPAPSAPPSSPESTSSLNRAAASR